MLAIVDYITLRGIVGKGDKKDHPGRKDIGGKRGNRKCQRYINEFTSISILFINSKIVT